VLIEAVNEGVKMMLVGRTADHPTEGDADLAKSSASLGRDIRL